jgi:nucleoside-diphosphate-sugar epimerase
MASVYLAQDQVLDREVAVKVIHPHLARDKSFVDKFRREAKVAAKLSHPNLVNVFDQGTDGDVIYLVMEYVPGITLRDAMNDFGALDQKKTLEIIEPLTAALAAAHAAGIDKLLFLGSSCVYPKMAQQPIKEEYLLTGELEKTNEAYALAKISGLKLVQAYRNQYGHHWISAMPTNMYGPGDNFDLENSHVLPALIRKFDDAKSSGAASVTLWGSGTPKREFLHADDLGRACVYLLENYNDDVAINVGVGEDVSIKELAELIKDTVGFSGSIKWDSSKPDGTPRKLLDVSRITALGWKAQISLKEGIASTYEWYKSNHK